MAKLNKKAITALKIIVSVALIYFIFTKIDFTEVLKAIKKTKPWYLFCALLMFVLSKILASFRLNTFFHQLQLPLAHKSNLKLYLLGMFYNLFLPGGIGGDAYKGFLIKKNFEIKTKKVVSVLVLDRLSGMLLLFIYACTLTLVLANDSIAQFKWAAALFIPLSLVVYYFISKRFLVEVLPVLWKALGFSALVQLAQLVMAFFIMKSLGIEENIIAYLVIFLVSSIASIFSIGGLGIREVTFYYGALLLHLNETTSVSISMIFFLITAMVSLFGVYYHFKNPKLETIQDQ